MNFSGKKIKLHILQDIIRPKRLTDFFHFQ